MEEETLIDIHTHSNLSPDSAEEPMDMAARACELGVKHFALTDHIELDEFGDGEWDYWVAIERSKPTFERLKSEFGGDRSAAVRPADRREDTHRA